MINKKSREEIKLMRQAGNIVALVHQEMARVIEPGISTLELDKIAYDIIKKNKAIPTFLGYCGYPNSICASINEEVVHGIPSKDRILKEGDIVSIDIGACYKGFHGDSAWTYPVGNISEEAKRLLEVTEASLYYGLAQAKVGNRITDISHAIQTYVESFGYSVPRDYTGHGIGREVHEDPIVPNFGVPNRGPQLKKGMTIAVEPMVNAGLKETRVLNDDWTVVTADGKLSAHFEHTVVITENGYEIFTKL